MLRRFLALFVVVSMLLFSGIFAPAFAADAIHSIEDDKEAMKPFYAALSRSKAAEAGAVTRIVHYGDSLIEMDLLSGETRRLLQKKFGDAGHGFIHVAKTRTWYRHDDVLHRPEAKWIAYHLKDRDAPVRRFGLGGAVSFPFKPGAKAVIGTVRRGDFGREVSNFEILVLRTPSGERVKVEIDGKSKGTFSTKSTTVGDGFVKLRVPRGQHKLTLTAADAGVMLYGVILENDGPGVVYDALGVNGIGATALLRSEKGHWPGQIAHRNPDLVILGFGTNEAGDQALDVRDFKSGLTRVVREVKKALPGSSILLMAPMDRAAKRGGRIETMPNLPKIVQAEREVARENGVAFWSAFDAMGGEGSMGRWYRQKPRLASGDFLHPTKEGSKVLGRMWYDALMDGFARYARQKGAAKAPVRARPADPLVQIPLE